MDSKNIDKMLKILLEYFGTILIFFLITQPNQYPSQHIHRKQPHTSKSYPFDAYSMRHFCLFQLFQGHWNGDNGS